MNYFKRLETILIAVIILVLGVAYGVLNNSSKVPTSNSTVNDTQQQVQTQQVPNISEIKYLGVEGRTALDLLKVNHNVETESFGDLGEMVKGIDGVEPDSSHFWSFYLNGAQAQVGASGYVTKPTDVIEWKLEKIQ
jgi:hypothetical protein